MKTLLICLFSLALIGSATAQEFIIPESAAYDSHSGSYFISNYGDGNIVQIDSTGSKAVFVSGLSKSLGMIIKDGTLYVVSNPKTVRGFRIADSSLAFNLEIKEAQFLNDITIDDSGHLYVTDSDANAVFKINVACKTYSLFVKTKLDNPNGIVFDRTNNRLVLCYFISNAPVDQISLSDSVLSTIVDTGFDNLDGIALDESGNFYISSWGAGSFSSGFNENGIIYKFDNEFKNEPVKVSTGYRGPADIFYVIEKRELIIPLFLANDVKFLILK